MTEETDETNHQLMQTIQLDPSQIQEIWIQPNMCFKIIIKDFDGNTFEYRAHKGKVFVQEN